MKWAIILLIGLGLLLLAGCSGDIYSTNLIFSGNITGNISLEAPWILKDSGGDVFATAIP